MNIMENNTSNNFCKKYVYKYIDCLNLNYTVFGKDHGSFMCEHIKEIIENSNCDLKKIFNKTLKEIDDNVKKNLPSPS
jgi:hypothetical protein